MYTGDGVKVLVHLHLYMFWRNRRTTVLYPGLCSHLDLPSVVVASAVKDVTGAREKEVEEAF